MRKKGIMMRTAHSKELLFPGEPVWDVNILMDMPICASSVFLFYDVPALCASVLWQRR